MISLNNNKQTKRGPQEFEFRQGERGDEPTLRDPSTAILRDLMFAIAQKRGCSLSCQRRGHVVVMDTPVLRMDEGNRPSARL
jgi:hypothetical protein